MHLSLLVAHTTLLEISCRDSYNNGVKHTNIGNFHRGLFLHNICSTLHEYIWEKNRTSPCRSASTLALSAKTLFLSKLDIAFNVPIEYT